MTYGRHSLLPMGVFIRQDGIYSRHTLLNIMLGEHLRKREREWERERKREREREGERERERGRERERERERERIWVWNKNVHYTVVYHTPINFKLVEHSHTNTQTHMLTISCSGYNSLKCQEYHQTLSQSWPL